MLVTLKGVCCAIAGVVALAPLGTQPVLAHQNNGSQSQQAMADHQENASYLASSSVDLVPYINDYAELVYQNYQDSHGQAMMMPEAIAAFLAQPTAENQKAAQDAWIMARQSYLQTEAFRFYEGPIDFVDSETGEEGPEGRINAWPMNEAFIDYVRGKADAGIADPNDQNEDGVSGRPNHVWSVESQASQLGRFGWKANEPTLKQQIAGAFSGDIGLTTSLFPASSCSDRQRHCQEEATFGDQPEVSDIFLEKVTTYVGLLGVPARRDIENPEAQAGERLFYQGQCASCHIPRYQTGNRSEHAEYNNQVIHPYTDLLLHDMGEDLADHRPYFEADGQEWRTPPLWGIGLVKMVNDHTFFLHDGRARDLMEAILWHGGEADTSKQFVLNLSEGDRSNLITFLESL